MRLVPPLDADMVRTLPVGTRVLISGRLVGARDQAHLRLIAALAEGRELPFDPWGAIMYYVGPTPPSPGRAVGAAGPTTSTRMDALVEPLFAAGIRATMGKGPRNAAAKAAMKKHGAIYLAATGGAGALLGACIEKAQVIAYEDLGPEALRCFEVRDFPATVAIDADGNDLYELGPARFRKQAPATTAPSGGP
jgi:fumarate hydratase subunit beta